MCHLRKSTHKATLASEPLISDDKIFVTIIVTIIVPVFSMHIPGQPDNRYDNIAPAGKLTPPDVSSFLWAQAYRT